MLSGCQAVRLSQKDPRIFEQIAGAFASWHLSELALPLDESTAHQTHPSSPGQFIHREAHLHFPQQDLPLIPKLHKPSGFDCVESMDSQSPKAPPSAPPAGAPAEAFNQADGSSPTQEGAEVFVTEFELEENSNDPPQLGIQNQGHVNRPLITRDAIRDTGFSAILQRVQYGTHKGTPACLIVMDLSFRFMGRTLSRYSHGKVEVKFSRAVDPSNHKIVSPQPREDPKVVNMAPKEVYGIVKMVEGRNYREVSIPVMFESPVGASAGVEATFGSEETEHQEHRMEIYGDLSWDDDHTDAACGATWDLRENEAQRDGIFRSFRAAIIVENLPDIAMWMRVKVVPSVKFSINPARLFSKRLLQKNDDPVLLDGTTPYGAPVGQGIDFHSGQFPWASVVWMPSEYKVCAEWSQNTPFLAILILLQSRLWAQVAEDEQCVSDLPPESVGS